MIKTSVERDCLATWPQTQALSNSSLPSFPGYERQGGIRNLLAVPTLETSLLPPCYSPSQRCLEERQRGGGGGQAALQDRARTKAASITPTALAGEMGAGATPEKRVWRPPGHRNPATQQRPSRGTARRETAEKGRPGGGRGAPSHPAPTRPRRRHRPLRGRYPGAPPAPLRSAPPQDGSQRPPPQAAPTAGLRAAAAPPGPRPAPPSGEPEARPLRPPRQAPRWRAAARLA